MLSLRVFHVFFIVASILLALATAAWGVGRYRADGSPLGLVMATLFFAAGFALLLYAVRYFGKLRRLDR